MYQQCNLWRFACFSEDFFFKARDTVDFRCHKHDVFLENCYPSCSEDKSLIKKSEHFTRKRKTVSYPVNGTLNRTLHEIT